MEVLFVIVLVFLVKYIFYIGCVIVLIIEMLWILNDQKNVIKKIGINIFVKLFLVFISGVISLLIKWWRLIFKIMVIIVISIIIIVIGISVLKDFDIEGGICFGIFMVIFFVL